MALLPSTQTPEAGGLVDIVLPLARDVPKVLGCGAFLKNRLCLALKREAWLTRPLGNLDNRAAITAYEAAARTLIEHAGGPLRAAARDLHPDFHSTLFAESLGCSTHAVQHHHAHIAAVAAEHGVDAPLLGLALDGFGLGPEGQAWGGELLRVDGPRYRRLGHLAMLAQPGGDAAARQPWRMGAAALHALGRGGEIPSRFAPFAGASLLARMLARGINSFETSSCGRLFDAACGLLGVVPQAGFEGEAPMALERLARSLRVMEGGWEIDAANRLSFLPLLDRLAGMEDAAEGAGLFHGTLAAGLADWVGRAAEESGLRVVAFGGGCFLNKLLRRDLKSRLQGARIEVLEPRRLGPGDEAVALGQAWVAALSEE